MRIVCRWLWCWETFPRAAVINPGWTFKSPGALKSPVPGSYLQSLSYNWPRCIRASVGLKSSPGDPNVQLGWREWFGKPRFSKCGSWAGTNHFTWALLRHANSQPPLQNYWIRNWGWCPAIWGFTSPPGGPDAAQVWEPLLKGHGQQTLKAAFMVPIGPRSAGSAWASPWEALLLPGTERVGGDQVVRITKVMTTWCPRCLNLN